MSNQTGPPLNLAYELRLVTTKGGTPRFVGVIPELLERTKEYINGPRARIIDRAKASKGSMYKEPAQIFLSQKTAMPLNLTSISNMLKKWFTAAGVDSHGHRLRAVYLTNLFEAEVAAEEARISAFPGTKIFIDYELVLRKVAERAGHKDIESLRPYLNLVKKRKLRQSDEPDSVTLQQRIQAQKQELAFLSQKANEQKKKLQEMESSKNRS